MSLEEFSSGYYTLDMQIQSYSDGPVIESGVYDFLNEKIYSQTDAPITMKLSLNNGAYFNVDAENTMPPSVLALPESWVENLSEVPRGHRQKVFILKPSHSHLIHVPDAGYDIGGD